MSAPLAFVDCETTGLDPDRHEVWEVALILRADAGETSQVWQLPVDLGRAEAKALEVGRFYEHYRTQSTPGRAPRGGVTGPRTARKESRMPNPDPIDYEIADRMMALSGVDALRALRHGEPPWTADDDLLDRHHDGEYPPAEPKPKPLPGCFGCEGTGKIRWVGARYGLPCSCLHLTDDFDGAQ